jgi:hypothetical protein
MLKTIGIVQPPQLSTTVTDKMAETKRKKTKSYKISQEDVLMEFANEDEPGSGEEDDCDEVDRYAKAKLSISKEESVLEWWDKWSLIYPQLSQLAKWLLGVPASSATSERIFSASGRVLEERRQSLNGDVVNDILFLRNFRYM